MNLFSYDGKVVQVFNRVADLLVLNLMTLIGMIPAYCLMAVLAGLLPITPVTIIISLVSLISGSFLAALHYCLLRIVRGEDAYTGRSYLKALKDNFKQGSLLGTLFLLVFVILWADVRIIGSWKVPGTEGLTMPDVMIVICIAVMFIVYLTFLYAFPLQARFINTVPATMKNALLMALIAFPRTLLMVVVHVAVPIAVYYLGIWTVPAVLMFGLSVPACLCAYLYSPVLKRFEPQDADEAEGED